MSEKEELSDTYYQIVEISGTPLKSIPMTEEQEYYLKNILDPQIERWIADIDAFIEKQRQYREYITRTHDYKNYNSFRK